MNETIALRDVYCGNRDCRYLRREGKRRLVGRLSLGGIAELKCPECSTLAVYRVPVPAANC